MDIFKNSPVFSGYSVSDIAAAKQFYTQILGLDASVNEMGILELKFAHCVVIIYPKDDHQPATFTVLNFPVEDIDEAVNQLTSKGVVFEQYEGMTDESGVARGIAAKRGPDIAWFKDPAGNILSVLQEK